MLNYQRCYQMALVIGPKLGEKLSIGRIRKIFNITPLWMKLFNNIFVNN